MQNVKDRLLTVLRDERTGIEGFRLAAERLSETLVQEASILIPSEPLPITTPMAKTTGSRVKGPVVLIAILRAGLSMVPAFQLHFPGSPIGLYGFRRNKVTALPELYYENIPPLDNNPTVLLLDPMLATGGTSAAAINSLKQKGIAEEKIIFVGILGSAAGKARLEREFPKLRIVIGAVDPELNDKKFIVPGLGDFGDRYFGTVD